MWALKDHIKHIGEIKIPQRYITNDETKSNNTQVSITFMFHQLCVSILVILQMRLNITKNLNLSVSSLSLWWCVFLPLPVIGSTVSIQK